MNTNKATLVTATVMAALSLGLVSSTFAGPGPQYWAQQHAKAVAAAEAKEQPKMGCPNCKDSVVTTLQSAAGGKAQMRTTVVGAKHVCKSCGGEIKTVQGKTTNDMKANCPICAKAGPDCCKVSA